MARFYCPIPLRADHLVVLPDAVARHAFGALRLRGGERVTLFNGDGHEYSGVLSGHGQPTVQVLERLTPERESPLRILLAQSVSTGERMDLTIQKAVELGAHGIQPLVTRRTIVRLSGDKAEKRRAHWQAVAVSACEQCGRNVVPEVAPLLAFDVWCRRFAESGATGILLDPEGGMGLAQLPRPEGQLVLLAGPEGGFDPAERAEARAAGLVGARLGPRVLRTETAALAAIAALQTLWGDFASQV